MSSAPPGGDHSRAGLPPRASHSVALGMGDTPSRNPHQRLGSATQRPERRQSKPRGTAGT
jgi:hypothetical protein